MTYKKFNVSEKNGRKDNSYTDEIIPDSVEKHLISTLQIMFKRAELYLNVPK